ncbi:DUF2147 domain-containing protein [Streptomyces sp. AcH 505]|uniref:DUF2147 domain-containing protein n=1 Tax=Streptomyces sp. AcH 505 TaxID=352211 RepID=UPI0018E30935
MTQMTSIMRNTVCVASLLALVTSGLASGNADPSGTWLTEDGRARIRVERCGSALEQVCGYIVWMKDPFDANRQPLKDQNNPDRAKRSRPVLGHQLILGLAPNPKGYFAGQIYDAESGKSYEISLWRESADRLKVKGCMLSVFCLSQTWTQTIDVLSGQLVGMTGDPTGPRADNEWVQVSQVKSPQPKPPTIARASR